MYAITNKTNSTITFAGQLINAGGVMTVPDTFFVGQPTFVTQIQALMATSSVTVTLDGNPVTASQINSSGQVPTPPQPQPQPNPNSSVGNAGGQLLIIGGLRIPGTVVNANFTADPTIARYYLAADNLTITLPTSANQDTTWEFVSVTGSANPGHTFAPNNSGTINGASTLKYLHNYGIVRILKTGSITFQDVSNSLIDQVDIKSLNVQTRYGADPTGSVDISGQFNTAMAAAVNKNELYVSQGTYKVAAELIPPSRAVTRLTPGTTLQNYQTEDVPSEDHNIFFSGSATRGDFPPATTIICSGTLAATPTPNSPQTISFSGTIKPVAATTTAQGNFIELRRDSGGSIDYNKQQMFEVIAVSGSSSPWTVTLDRPILWPYQSGDTAITVSSIPQAIVIDGNYAQINFVTGGDSPIQFFETRDFHVSKLICDAKGTSTGFGALADISCYRGVFEDCVFRGFRLASVISSAEGIVINRCRFEYSVNVADGAGLRLWDAINFKMLASASAENLYGVVTDSNGGSFGGQNLLFNGTNFDDNQLINIALTLGNGITFRDCTARGGNQALTVAAAITGLIVDGLDVSGCLSSSIQCLANNAKFSRVLDIRAAASSSQSFFIGTNIYYDNCTLDITAVTLSGYGAIQVSGSMYVRGNFFNLGSLASYAFVIVSGGKLRIGSSIFVGSGSMSAVLVESGGTLIVEQDNDFGGLPIVISSGGFSNFGPVASLPTALIGGQPGTWGYATNGRKSGEGSGSGTGVPVWQSANGSWYTGAGVAVTA